MSNLTKTIIFKESDYIKFNVGGRLFLTSYTTLTKYDSMLKAMITGEVPLTVDSDGFILIDRDGTYFDSILNFIRDSSIKFPENEFIMSQVQKEANFYNLKPLEDYCKSITGFEDKLPVVDIRHALITDNMQFIGIVEKSRSSFSMLVL